MARSSGNRRTPEQLHAVNPPDTLAAIDIDKFLSALSACESNHNDRAVGKAGERGRYQIRRSTWSSFGRGVFDISAHDPVAARDCAIRYLRSLGRILLDHGTVPNALDLATMWNRGTLLAGPNDFANRVSNLYHDAFKSQTSNSASPIVQARHYR